MKACAYVMFSLVGHWVHNNTHTNGVFCPFYSVPRNREHILNLNMGSKPMFQQSTSVVTVLAFLSLYRVKQMVKIWLCF